MAQASAEGGERFDARLWAGTLAPLLAAFGLVAWRYDMSTRIGGHMASGFASFALLLAPYWAFGFGAADALRRALTRRLARVLAPGTLVIAYLIFSIPRGELRWYYAAILFAIPVGLAAMFELAPPRGRGLAWQDVVALVVVGAPVEFRLLAGTWPHPGLSALPKLLLVDSALYAFLVVRGLDGVGFDFRLRLRDLAAGLREWAFYAPIAIGLGLALGFLHWNPWQPRVAVMAASYLITFFFVAIPEELFFRGLLQNLLEPRLGRGRALAVTAVIFGLSHFNKPLPFNWRYVILAAIAGVFYGRAWLDRRRLTCSAVTHTTVDVVWGLWWR
ncbi:MAG: CPBP family intramembrane metalloprotease [Acidobacteriia bacterium]|nr:CPBP family intramembrane metalloprotease [Terriglobia bacterium]